MTKGALKGCSRVKLKASNVAGKSCCFYLKGEGCMKALASKERTTKARGLPNLRMLRQRKGLSIGQLADLTGLRRDTITHLESGREDPQPYHIRLLARVLDVRQLDLVS
jgi:DNA-binding XRE family transcriptional regulator